MHFIFPPTVQELKDNADYPIDVFQETFGQMVLDASIKNQLYTQAWARFRNRCIGDYDVSYWIQCLQDKITVNWLWYSRVIAALVDDGILSLFESESYVNNSGYNEGHSTSSSHLNHGDTLEHSDIPHTAPDGTKYLTSKDQDTVEDFNEGNGSTNNTTSGTTTANASSSLKIERLNKLMNELQKANNKFFDELDPLFMNHL